MIHLAAIRQALANGNAAVMIGAGFSRNAVGGHQLKTWLQLGEELWAALNPAVPMKALSPSLVTQLGEQYARVFSRSALDELLKRHIPDDRVVPGPLHDELVALPWCEIFTTNYDTLLERAAERVFERAHLTVCCREDIPQSKILGRRRIVKLHGSFPSQRPFIFTEEDYRKYPKDFAPFVNLVRQSLLENVFCLIGFSGDDPNFLNWIGWVRDMLDQHTLPIYLFVTHPPSLGELKLLEVRHVVPVLLPESEESKEGDYYGRYQELFRLLKAPLKNADEQWGDIAVPSHFQIYEENEDRKFQSVLEMFPLLSEQQKHYPCWIIAPQEIRWRFERSLHRMPLRLDDFWLIRRLTSEPAPVALVLLSQYSWQQEVLLQPLQDNSGSLAVGVLRGTSGLQLATLPPEVREIVDRLRISSQIEFERYWLDLALGVLRWSRQALNEATFNDITALIRNAPPNGNNSIVADELQYELVLLRLHQGERDEARKLLADWKITSADAYMLVRKGSLLAELNDIEAGLALCLDAIQILRRSQKIAPGSALLLSQEAWACLIAHNMQQSKNFISFTPGAQGKDDPSSMESLGRRLLDLAAKGFDVRKEHKAITAALSAEALPPTSPIFRFGEFDLGRATTTQRFGWPSELRSKVEAAFSWLALSERVGLAPRIGNVTFDLDSYTQAAWWVQHADSTQRMLSIVIRSLNTDVLKPRDDSVPRHKTGWLSRFQVARMDIVLAADLAERSLRQIESALTSGLPNNEVERVCGFYAEVFSRLVLRLKNTEQILTFARRIITLHVDSRLKSLDRSWEVFARALARCFEALPITGQLALVPLVSDLPVVPRSIVDEHYLSRWVQPFELSRWLPPPSAEQVKSPSFDRAGNELLRQLRNRGVSVGPDPIIKAIWLRLHWLNHLGLLSEVMRNEVGKLLWSMSDTWPIVPGFRPEATSHWPAPIGVEPDERFREWIIGRSLTPFASPSSGEEDRKSWRLSGDEEYLNAWLVSLDAKPWPQEAITAGLVAIHNWWKSEGDDLGLAMLRLDDLREAVVHRLNLIDEILFKVLDQSSSEEGAYDGSLWSWFRQLVVDTGDIGAPFWRFRLRAAELSGDLTSIRIIEEELTKAFLYQNDAQQLYHAQSVANSWMDSVNDDEVRRPNLLLDTWISIVSARRMPALSLALGLLARAAQIRGEWLIGTRTQMIKFGLRALLVELDYQKRPSGSGIPDDEVPLLRFRCAELAFALKQANLAEVESISNEWLLSAEHDPLAELRFGRYRSDTA